MIEVELLTLRLGMLGRLILGQGFILKRLDKGKSKVNRGLVRNHRIRKLVYIGLRMIWQLTVVKTKAFRLDSLKT